MCALFTRNLVATSPSFVHIGITGDTNKSTATDFEIRDFLFLPLFDQWRRSFEMKHGRFCGLYLFMAELSQVRVFFLDKYGKCALERTHLLVIQWKGGL